MITKRLKADKNMEEAARVLSKVMFRFTFSKFRNHIYPDSRVPTLDTMVLSGCSAVEI